MAMAIVAIGAPFIYSQISKTNQTIRYIAIARNIVSFREPVLNYIRINQDKWPDTVQIRLSDEDLGQIADVVSAGFVDKYVVRGATITDVYLAFDLQTDEFSLQNIARNIGTDAAVVGPDGVAYGNTWAVAAPDFKPGYLIYKISRDFSGEDNTKYLHRGTSGEDELNVMMRNLNMGGHNMLDVGAVTGKSVNIKNITTSFVESEMATASNIYFSAGANMDGGDVKIGTMRVSGDVAGFRNIYADKLNGTGYSTNGRIIADRANVEKSVNVARNFVLRSESSKTIGAFVGMTINALVAPYLSAEEILFHEDFGLTVSGELLMSTTPPLKFGAWSFPSTTPPKFAVFQLNRARIPAMVSANEFGAIITDGWQTRLDNTDETQQ